MQLKQLLFSTLLATLTFAGATFAQAGGDHDHDGDHPTSKPAAKVAKIFKGDPYLLDVDIVTGKSLGELKDQVTIDFEGRELRFSSEKSAKTFRTTPKDYIKKIDALMIADQLPLYPLTTCMVTGEKLGGEMGDAVDMIYKNRLVRFCCKMCIKKFNKAPDKFIAELNAAVIKAQVKDYPYKTCLISGEELGGEMGDVIDRVVGGRLVRLCCKMCIKKFNKDPQRFIAELDAARAGEEKAKHGKSEGHGDHEH